ncbi:MAG: intradiol ring-cleavage dioxygenase [Burkholderiales bacterium]
MINSRRRFLAATAMLGIPAGALRAHSGTLPTPGMTAGPFYPESFSADPVGNLVRGPLKGNIVLLRLEGRVADRRGRGVEGARVEIWQCDGLGRYTHSRDGQPADRDPNFAGFGWVRTDAKGAYAFSTIRPVVYTGRTPHIHVAVKARGHTNLVTQMFIEGEPGNASDSLYRSLSAQQRALLTAAIAAEGSGQRARFDLTLA